MAKIVRLADYRPAHANRAQVKPVKAHRSVPLSLPLPLIITHPWDLWRLQMASQMVWWWRWWR